EYDLEEVLTQLSIGEAIVTVMNEKGAPTPVAWTRLRAPQGSMSPTPAAQIEATVTASPLMVTYGTAVNPPSAAEDLQAQQQATQAQKDADESAERTRKEAERLEKEAGRTTRSTGSRRTTRSTSRGQSTLDKAVGEASRTLAREIVKNLFKRRR
ncbi:MAG: DUF853 family protein, partial [Actinomycetales bacterium]